jgi:hypothetical protein
MNAAVMPNRTLLRNLITSDRRHLEIGQGLYVTVPHILGALELISYQ